jgi:hypothetical protein
MSVCKNLKGYVRDHEQVADFFSLLAVVLLFGSLYLATVYYGPLLSWMQQNAILHVPAIVSLLLLDVLLIFLCLSIGAARFGEEEESCFHTFRGRRGGSGSLGMMFNGWLHHIEQVGRKHR